MKPLLTPEQLASYGIRPEQPEKPQLVKSQERESLNDGPAVSEPMPLLSEPEMEGFRSQWSKLQTGFVDEPRQAVEAADTRYRLDRGHLLPGADGAEYGAHHKRIEPIGNQYLLGEPDGYDGQCNSDVRRINSSKGAAAQLPDYFGRIRYRADHQIWEHHAEGPKSKLAAKVAARHRKDFRPPLIGVAYHHYSLKRKK